MTKLRKKHNKNARLMKESNVACRNSMLFSIIGLAEEGQIWVLNNIPQAQITAKNAVQHELMFNVPRQWSFVFGVACRDQLGRTYLSYDFVRLKNHFCLKSREIREFTNDEINKKLEDVNPDHVLTPFFIANPEAREYDDQQIYKLLAWKRTFERIKTIPEFDRLRAVAMDELRQIDPLRYCNDKPLWTILRQHNINDFADVRLVGLGEIEQFKGIGEKRVERLIDGYNRLVNDPAIRPQLTQFIEFETQIALRQHALDNYTTRTANETQP